MATEGVVPPPLAPPTLSKEAFTVRHPSPLENPSAYFANTTHQSVLWAGTALVTVALAFRYYVRIKCFRRLLADDCIIGFAWCIYLAQVITLQTILKDMYEIAEIGARLRMPTADLPKILSRNSKAQVAVVWLLYSGIYAIKANFLVFFHKLGRQVRMSRRCIQQSRANQSKTDYLLPYRLLVHHCTHVCFIRRRCRQDPV